ncbi:MAG: hypothetical protein IPH36_13875 [Saprospiraceae bacterium]|nr:hypothetical protein [Saprospiraceae bacterium]
MKKCRFWVLNQKKCGNKKDSRGEVFLKKCQIFTVFQLVSKNNFEKKEEIFGWVKNTITFAAA